MRRITTWIAGALVVVALAVAYQVSQTGDGEHPSAAAAAQSESSTSSTAKPDDGRTGGTADEHTGKPGENK